MKNKTNFSGILISLLLLILVVTALAFVFGARTSDTDDEIEPTPTPEVIATDEPQVEETAEPEVTVTPVPTVAPTVEPTVEPTVAPTVLKSGSGTLTSGTGHAIDIEAVWTATETGSGTYVVNVKLYVLSYSLECVEIPYGGKISVDGYTDVTFNTAEVMVEGDGRETNYLGEASITLTSMPVDMTVTWQFNGYYSGEEINGIEASGLISVS